MTDARVSFLANLGKSCLLAPSGLQQSPPRLLFLFPCLKLNNKYTAHADLQAQAAPSMLSLQPRNSLRSLQNAVSTCPVNLTLSQRNFISSSPSVATATFLKWSIHCSFSNKGFGKHKREGGGCLRAASSSTMVLLVLLVRCSAAVSYESDPADYATCNVVGCTRSRRVSKRWVGGQ